MNNYKNEQELYLTWINFSNNEKDVEKLYNKLKEDWLKEDPDYGFKEFIERNRFSQSTFDYMSEINKNLQKKLEEEISEVYKNPQIQKIKAFDPDKAHFIATETLLHRKVPVDYVEPESLTKKIVKSSLNFMSNPKVKIAMAATAVGMAAAAGAGPVALALLASSKGASIWLSSGGADKLANKLDPQIDAYMEKNGIPQEEPSKYKKLIANVIQNNKFKIGAGIALGIVGMSASSIASAAADMSHNVIMEDGVSRVLVNNLENNREIVSGIRTGSGPLYSGDNYGYTEKAFVATEKMTLENLNSFKEISPDFQPELYDNAVKDILSSLKQEIIEENLQYHSMSAESKVELINTYLEKYGLENDINIALPTLEDGNLKELPPGNKVVEEINNKVELRPSSHEISKSGVELRPGETAPKKITIPQIDKSWAGDVYTVSKGDSIWKIARGTFDGQLEEIAKQNLPENATSQQIKTESLRLINSRVSEITTLNGQIVKPDLIYPEQKIKMPDFDNGLIKPQEAIEIKRQISIPAAEVAVREHLPLNNQVKVAQEPLNPIEKQKVIVPNNSQPEVGEVKVKPLDVENNSLNSIMTADSTEELNKEYAEVEERKQATNSALMTDDQITNSEEKVKRLSKILNQPEIVGDKPQAPEVKIDPIGNKPQAPETKIDPVGDKPQAPETKIDPIGNKPQAPEPKIDSVGDKPQAPETKIDPFGDKPQAPEAKIDPIGNKPQAPEAKIDPIGNKPQAPETKIDPVGDKPQVVNKSGVSQGGDYYDEESFDDMFGAPGETSVEDLIDENSSYERTEQVSYESGAEVLKKLAMKGGELSELSVEVNGQKMDLKEAWKNRIKP